MDRHWAMQLFGRAGTNNDCFLGVAYAIARIGAATRRS